MEEFRSEMGGRYFFLYIIYFCCFILVIGLVIRIQFKYHDEWMEGYEEYKQAPTPLTDVAPRGNIYSADGNLLATSMPLYRVYMDMHTAAQASIKKGHTECLMEEKADSLALGLSQLLKEKSQEEYKELLLRNFRQKPRGCHHVALCRRPINYVELQELQKMPILSLHPMQGGLLVEPIYKRTHPYGMLAERTIGNVYAVEQKAGTEEVTGGSGHYGLEYSFDSILCGENGIMYSHKVSGKRIQEVVKEATPGKDIVTTLDTHLQEIADEALRHMVDSVHPDWACAVLMETKTGHIKAIVNLGMLKDSSYAEIQNYAMSMAVEPGSTFKPIALMATIDAGYVTTKDRLNIGGKRWLYSEKENPIIDDGDGLGTISLREVIAASSNIGMAKTVTRFWENNKSGLVRKIHEIGIVDQVNCDLKGAAIPKVTTPKYFSELARMSFGYFVELPVIYSLMWYNAVANEGKMMRPMLVTDIQENGTTLKHFDPEVVQEQICKPSTLKQIQEALYSVVWDSAHATGKLLRSPYVKIAGKTGTAQIQTGGGYNNQKHRVSFVGYFPYENPEYTCMVVLHNVRTRVHTGGRLGGPVVREIAERTMIAKSAQPLEAKNIKTDDKRPIPVKRSLNEVKENRTVVPDVRHMGARDAVYLIERTGMQARVTGVGSVVSQSVQPGQPARKGEVVTLVLR